MATPLTFEGPPSLLPMPARSALKAVRMPTEVPARDAGWEAERADDPVVMMVDDEPLNLEVLQTFLEEAGYRDFVACSEPLKALGLIGERHPDVVLLDLNMPEMSGFEIIERMRADEAMRHVPVIVLTSSTDAETKLKALELGATDFLAKPTDPSELALRLRNTLSAKAYRDRLANYDSVTALPNRRLLVDRLERALRETARAGTTGALMHVHLERFEQITEAFGLGIGDSLLKGVAMRLDLGLRSSVGARESGERRGLPTIYRIGDDEFAILLTGIARGEEAAPIAQGLLAAMTAPFRAAGQELTIGCERRHLGVPRRRHGGGRAPQPLQRRCPPRGASGRQGLPVLRQGAQLEVPAPAERRERAAPGARARRVPSLLPAEGPRAQRPRHRRRGAAAVGASGTRARAVRASSFPSPRRPG